MARDKATNIYSIKLHNFIEVESGFFIYRVPGGWLYEVDERLCFIPFSNEFQAVAPEQGEAKNLTSNNSGSYEMPANIKEVFTKFVAEQKDIPPEFAQVVNDNFWDLL